MMVEQGMGSGGSYQQYPPPLATYDDVVASPNLFLDTLTKLHASTGTKFMIPTVGGRDLDLYRLFMEVTSRGGIANVVKERKWNEVTAVFSFPSSAMNVSFILRKYYISLLYHFEQIYFFKAKCWTTSPVDVLQNVSTITAPPVASPQPIPQQTHGSAPQDQSNVATPMTEVCGVIDGKFDGGYLITARIGSEELRGVLYQVQDEEAQRFANQTPEREDVKKYTNHSSTKPRRKCRKKSEIQRRDPAHPKSNRSGYSFFLAEQYARLKPLCHGREIIKIIGDSWNKLQEHERAVYQEKALKDKERYKLEMEAYRERLRTGQVVAGNAVPIQQCLAAPEVDLTDINRSNLHYEMGSDKGGKSNLEEYESLDKDSEFGEYSLADMELKNVNIEVLADEAFDLYTRTDRAGGGEDDGLAHGAVEEQDKTLSSGEGKNVFLDEDGISVPIEERELSPSNAD